MADDALTAAEVCRHKLGALHCDRADKHDENATGGHTYSASWAADRHDESEGRDE